MFFFFEARHAGGVFFFFFFFLLNDSQVYERFCWSVAVGTECRPELLAPASWRISVECGNGV
jgi:hypothetical protein